MAVATSGPDPSALREVLAVLAAAGLERPPHLTLGAYLDRLVAGELASTDTAAAFRDAYNRTIYGRADSAPGAGSVAQALADEVRSAPAEAS